MSEPEKRGPGRPRVNPESAVDIERGLSADAKLSPHMAEDENESVEDAIKRIRQIRKPFGAFSQKLALPIRPGYHRHWFNDEPGRCDQAEASGWTYVKDHKTGAPKKIVVGSGRDKGALYAYAMEIPDLFWVEDMEARHEAASSKMSELKKSPFRARAGEAQASDKGKFYSPEADPLQVAVK